MSIQNKTTTSAFILNINFNFFFIIFFAKSNQIFSEFFFQELISNSNRSMVSHPPRITKRMRVRKPPIQKKAF